MRSRRFSRRGAVVAAAFVAATAAAAAYPRDGSRVPTAATVVPNCTRDEGGPRWAVKTLSDPAARSVDFAPHTTTVRALTSLPRPSTDFGTPRRTGVEMRTYRIRVSFRKIGFTNSDDDMTLKVFDPGRPQIGMEVEFPDTRCPAAGSSAKKAEMARARTALIRACGAQERLVTGRGIVTGVGFFDIPHSEPYIAPNSIELHPVLAIRILSCKKGPLQPD